MIFTQALSGPHQPWSIETEDLDATLVSWEEGSGVTAHVNSQVDVVMVVLAGNGIVRVGSEEQAIEPGMVVVIPKSSVRRVRATKGRLTYLNVHKRRGRLMPNMTRGSATEGAGT